MCGIVGAIAERNITAILVEGLKRLEYRGYDSAGLALLDAQGELQRLRRIGKVSELEAALLADPWPVAWASPTPAGRPWCAHRSQCPPAFSQGDVAVVHNGIIENHEALRAQLKAQGYVFTSQTDTEVIVHLLHLKLQDSGDLTTALKAAVKELHGALWPGGGLAPAAGSPGGDRSGSPLVIGPGSGRELPGSP